MCVIIEDPPLSELLQEEKETDKATGHGNDNDKGSQEEMPCRQRRKRGNVSRPLPWWVLHGRGCVLH